MAFDPDQMQWEKWAFHPLVASVLGAASSFFNSVPGQTKAVRVANAFTSFLVGVYGGSFVVVTREIQSKPLIGVVHIFLAVSGVILMAGFLDWLSTTKFADLPVVSGFLRAQKGATSSTPPPQPTGERN